MTATAFCTKPEGMNSLSQHEPFAAALEILAPELQRVPLVFASPHSGCDYPGPFLAQSALDPMMLRRSEDSYVDQLYAAAPAHGAPLLKALFPRAYLDVNREPYELDPAMFDEILPPYVKTDSPRVRAGLGTIARLVSSGAEIYNRKLSFAEAERRVRELYRPYHAARSELVDRTRQRFGYCILVDCHSMPSPGGDNTGEGRVDFVLGDCFGSACHPGITRAVDAALRHRGYRVLHNTPYAGGFTTRHYGKPHLGVHALQIEVDRGLYMDEATHIPTSGFSTLRTDLTHLIAALAAFPARDLLP